MALNIFVREDPKFANLSRELAFRHLWDLGADIQKECVAEVAEMIRLKFVAEARRIKEADFSRILDSLPSNDKAAGRARTFIQKREITDVETLIRLKAADIRKEFGFNDQTVYALQEALEKNRFRLAMLFERPLNK